MSLPNNPTEMESRAKYPILEYCDKFEHMFEPIKYRAFYHLKVDEEQLEKLNTYFEAGLTLDSIDETKSVKTTQTKNEKMMDILDKIEEAVKDVSL